MHAEQLEKESELEKSEPISRSSIKTFDPQLLEEKVLQDVSLCSCKNKYLPEYLTEL